MTTVTVSSSRGPYAVLVEVGAAADLVAACRASGLVAPAAVVTDSNVGPLWLDRIAPGTGESRLELPAGEVFKRWPQVETLCSRWLADGLHRGSLVAAVGGGVVTDTVGFAASIFMRGIDWVAAPTSLLAMVDAAVGGKTGVNLAEGKNLVGTFWPPRLVVADPEVLATLPPRELRAGLAEVLKHGWIAERRLLEHLERPVGRFSDLTPATWRELIGRAVAVKAEVVAADEREAGRRKALNLGHTLGHALEAATGYERFLHGEAVAWGLIGEARLARRLGLISATGARRLEEAAARLGPLPPIADLSADHVLERLGRDKKRDDLGVGWVLPTDDGVELEVRVGAEDVRAMWDEVQRVQGP